VSRTALVVVDVLSTYDHEDADRLAETAREALPGVRRLVEQAKDHDVLTVYVNDNFGVWNAGRAEIVEHVRPGDRFAELVEPLLPDEQTAFVVKARHSIFFETPLAYLLNTNDVDRVVLCGQVTEQCILYSALDAYVRHFDVVVATDAVAAIDDDLAAAALRMMERNMHAELTTSEHAFAAARPRAPAAAS
jgi:nicotinamidase-related amidase